MAKPPVERDRSGEFGRGKEEREEVGFDELMDVLEDGRAQILIERLAKSAAEHVLLRIGIDASNPSSIIEWQGAVAQIKETVREATRLGMAVESLRMQHTQHVEDDARQFKQIISNQNIAAQDRAVDRNNFTTKLEALSSELLENHKSTNRILIALLLNIAVTIIGALALKVYV